MLTSLGVVTSPPQSTGALYQADSYLIADAGKITWLDGETEHSVSTPIHDASLLALSSGASPSPELARESAVTAVRVLQRLFEAGTPRDPVHTLEGYLHKAHARIADRLRTTHSSASLALVWWTAGQVTWVEVGDCRVRIFRQGELLRAGSPWPLSRAQRLFQGSQRLGDDTALHFREGVNLGNLRTRRDDLVLLSSQGLHNAIDTERLNEILARAKTPQSAMVSYLHKARAHLAQGPLTALYAPAFTQVSHALSQARTQYTAPPVKLHRLRTLPTEP